MIEELQLINKALDDDDVSLLLKDNLDSSCFIEYSDIYEFILEYYKTYNRLPSDITIQAKSNKFQRFIDDKADTDYLIDVIKERSRDYQMFTYFQSVLNNADESSLNRELGENIVSKLKQIYKEDNSKHYNITDLKRAEKSEERGVIYTGWDKIDELLGGLRKGEELITIFARTGVGKSFFSLKLLNQLYKQGHNVAFISPEMLPETVAYRVDSINFDISNRKLMYNNFDEDYLEKIKEYQKYPNSFLISNLSNFNDRLTITKLDNYITDNKLSCLVLDGISYMVNERSNNKFQTETERLSDISKDLMTLSIKRKIPIIVIAQANRTQYSKKEKVADLRAIRDSDAISHISTRVISLGQDELNTFADETANIYFKVVKNRYGRLSDIEVFTANFDKGIIEYERTYSVQELSKTLNSIENKENQEDEIY